eukprot:10429487-Alexandrium_andersonii.AAC.1
MQHAILVESARARQSFAGGTREALGSQRVAALNDREGGRAEVRAFRVIEGVDEHAVGTWGSELR